MIQTEPGRGAGDEQVVPAAAEGECCRARARNRDDLEAGRHGVVDQQRRQRAAGDHHLSGNGSCEVEHPLEAAHDDIDRLRVACRVHRDLQRTECLRQIDRRDARSRRRSPVPSLRASRSRRRRGTDRRGGARPIHRSRRRRGRRAARGGRPVLVQGRRHLPAARQGVLRLQRRRQRRLPRPDRKARLHQGPGRQRRLAAALLSVAAQGRRVRRRRLPQRAPAVRDAQRLPALRARGAPPGPQGHHRARRQPHVGPAPLVPGRAPGARGFGQARLLRLERRPDQVRRHPHHLHRHRVVELGLGSGREGALLASLLQPSAGSQLRQSPGPEGDPPHHALLARHGGRRVPAGRDPLSVRARRHEQREPARDPRRHQADPRRPRRAVRGPRAARRGQPVARGRPRVLRRRRRMPHGLPLPADAAHVHGDRPGRPPSGRRDHAADAGRSGDLPVGDLPAQPRRADARDGHQQGTRLHVPDVRGRRRARASTSASGAGSHR